MPRQAGTACLPPNRAQLLLTLVNNLTSAIGRKVRGLIDRNGEDINRSSNQCQNIMKVNKKLLIGPGLPGNHSCNKSKLGYDHLLIIMEYNGVWKLIKMYTF